MDGNGRWAKSRGLFRSVGHVFGVKVFRTIVEHASNLGIKYMTFYAFSTENWNRPSREVSFIMKILKKEIYNLNLNFKKYNFIVNFLGNYTKISKDTLDLIHNVQEISRNNTGLVLNIAFSYGSRDEIINSIKLLYEDIINLKIKKEDITEEVFSNYLYTRGMPDPDLIIRTGGEARMSNFLLWQSAYAEFWNTNTLWPDFSTEEFEKALDDYTKRKRKFGNIT
ncbi:MAG: isoprenyl transferase [Candidatus Improbicoccus devescovinae]|nr:MAG: isoprenyl transferase [Candidatus Improbicoccus devescovinae]